MRRHSVPQGWDRRCHSATYRSHATHQYPTLLSISHRESVGSTRRVREGASGERVPLYLQQSLTSSGHSQNDLIPCGTSSPAALKLAGEGGEPVLPDDMGRPDRTNR